jgi:hypothetical protein
MNGLSNYPDNVTGQEYEIAGPDAEWQESLWCDTCDKVTLFDCQSYANTFSAACTICDHEHETWSAEKEEFEDGLIDSDDGDWDEDLDWKLEDGCAM